MNGARNTRRVVHTVDLEGLHERRVKNRWSDGRRIRCVLISSRLGECFGVVRIRGEVFQRVFFV